LLPKGPEDERYQHANDNGKFCKTLLFEGPHH